MSRAVNDHSVAPRPRAAIGWRPIVRGLTLLVGLSLSSTMVLGYADLLPQPTDRAAHDAPLSRVGRLPHVAQQLARGASLRIVAFGSSSTEGVGASSLGAAYPARLETALKRALPRLANAVTVLNRGIGGEHVDDMLKRIDRDVLAAGPDLVIWQTGSNDPLRGVALDHFRRATVAGVRRMQARGIDVVLMEPQWCPKLDATPGAYHFRDAVREIGHELGIPVIRRSDLMQRWIAEAQLTRSELFAADGLHMADRGYELLGQAVADDLLQGTLAGTAAVALADQ
ncbi:SGNH/GDSL hydrolase family protein [Methylobacterium nigriterrae]|uniref:SGNH/GDSL hydrolase family protein n=1 Tax=Methylobacterium nigriterrae TaxID=3127512 RepID=UPI0030139926